MAAAHSRWTVWARAITPILPIFMFHPGEVGQTLGAMVGKPGSDVVQDLVLMREVAFWPWLVVVAATAVAALFSTNVDNVEVWDKADIIALSLAAWLLPPFLTFTIYFCLSHAVRHMVGIASAVHPNRPGRALTFAAEIVLPCSTLCVIGLICLWDRASGLIGSQALIVHGLHLLAG